MITILVALILRFWLHRVIDRFTLPGRGGRRRFLGKLRDQLSDRLPGEALLESAGLPAQRRAQRMAALGSVLKSTTSFALFVLAALLVLGSLDVNLAPFIAGTSIVGVAIAFGAQNLVKDFLAGMFLLFEDQYGVGDVVDLQQASGTVEAVGWRTTRLRDENGAIWHVRNGEVVRVGNLSQGHARMVVDVPIAPDADLDAASARILAAARKLRADPAWAGAFLGEPELVGVEQLTPTATMLRVVARVRPLRQAPAARELRRRILESQELPQPPPRPPRG
ncbi:MAG: mechanosensitive ion channel family protein [Actinomycetia bacterium]|nr:mechanosensitive ion channel family protein [Actinomycetes bacterium]